MRHKKGFNHLSRKPPHRKAMLANMACSLIKHKRITTTVAKAKALKMYVEPLITKSKNDSTHSRRVVFSYLKDKGAVAELFRDVAAKIGERPGGYTRVLKTGNRLGDNAEMCLLELVDYNENMIQDVTAAPKGKKRTRRGKAKKENEAQGTGMDYLSGSSTKGATIEDAQIISDEVVPEVETEAEQVVVEGDKKEKETKGEVKEDTSEEEVKEEVVEEKAPVVEEEAKEEEVVEEETPTVEEEAKEEEVVEEEAPVVEEEAKEEEVVEEEAPAVEDEAKEEDVVEEAPADIQETAPESEDAEPESTNEESTDEGEKNDESESK